MCPIGARTIWVWLGTKYGTPSLSLQGPHSSFFKSDAENGPTIEGFRGTDDNDDDFLISDCPIR